MKFCKGCNAWISGEEVLHIYEHTKWKEDICDRCATTFEEPEK